MLRSLVVYCREINSNLYRLSSQWDPYRHPTARPLVLDQCHLQWVSVAHIFNQKKKYSHENDKFPSMVNRFDLDWILKTWKGFPFSRLYKLHFTTTTPKQPPTFYLSHSTLLISFFSLTRSVVSLLLLPRSSLPCISLLFLRLRKKKCGRGCKKMCVIIKMSSKCLVKTFFISPDRNVHVRRREERLFQLKIKLTKSHVPACEQASCWKK